MSFRTFSNVQRDGNPIAHESRDLPPALPNNILFRMVTRSIPGIGTLEPHAAAPIKMRGGSLIQNVMGMNGNNNENLLKEQLRRHCDIYLLTEILSDYFQPMNPQIQQQIPRFQPALPGIAAFIPQNWLLATEADAAKWALELTYKMTQLINHYNKMHDLITGFKDEQFRGERGSAGKYIDLETDSDVCRAIHARTFTIIKQAEGASDMLLQAERFQGLVPEDSGLVLNLRKLLMKLIAPAMLTHVQGWFAYERAHDHLWIVQDERMWWVSAGFTCLLMTGAFLLIKGRATMRDAVNRVSEDV